MAVYGDALAAFGNAQVVEIPPDLSVGGGIANTNDATAKNPLGTLYRYKGNLYRYVKFDNGGDNVAALANGVVHWRALDPSKGTFTVTSDYSGGIANINAVAGVILNAVTDLYHTWVQVGGVALVKTHASAVAGDVLIGASTDLVGGYIAADGNVTSVLFGVHLEATAATVAGKASCLLTPSALL